MSNKAFDTAANAGSSREHFASRIGFILIAAGCAIGIGNVWRFPYITGEYGGGAFVLLYLIFLVILGLPVMVMEFAVGRAAQKSAAQAFDILEPISSLGLVSIALKTFAATSLPPSLKVPAAIFGI